MAEIAGKQKKQSGLHAGHRQRMRHRVRQSGAASLADHELLEVLLYFTLPRGDTNALAHQLLVRFGSLSRVLEAEYDELLEVPGVGENTAFLLSFLPTLFRRYQMDRNGKKRIFGSTRAFEQYVCDLFIGENREVLYLICLNAGMHVLNSVRLAEGDIGSVKISVAEVVRAAKKQHARNVVLAHNHPGGTLKASNEDFEVTRRCMRALSEAGINLVEHLLVSGDKTFSFAEHNYMYAIREEVQNPLKQPDDDF
ncbi:MAG TPA: DNA repair protein RadC [Candidatus Avidehalobacter gallistercoris]|uniref:DNA repair protein RadC n=1 Tax=Candidatus Avidehalobacter gallistercoris TaxID=2840694 RepID=A0A9D1HLV8_9FIRM|nr:DNA repair protein RadC [Candidatus Avidehalobacter gallistercoris]